MESIAGTLAAPFPYFGGKSNAAESVWAAFGEVDNYVEAFANSAGETLWCSPHCVSPAGAANFDLFEAMQ